MSVNALWKQHPILQNPLPEFESAALIKRAVYEYEAHESDLRLSEWLWEMGFNISRSIPQNRNLIVDFDTALAQLLAEGVVEHIGTGGLRLAAAVRKDVEDQVHLFGYPRTTPRRRSPGLEYVVFGSGPSVRSDEQGHLFNSAEVTDTQYGLRSSVFSECIDHQNRETVAVDMEASAFYTALRNDSQVDRLVIKAVVDHADHLKGDSIHEFGKQLAAGFALEILRAYEEWPEQTPGHKGVTSTIPASPLEIELSTTLRVSGGDVSDPRWTVTAKNRSSVEFELTSFGLIVVGTDKHVTFFGGDVGDTALPHVLAPRRSGSVSAAYRLLADQLQKAGISTPVVLRGRVRDALGDSYESENQNWDYSEWLSKM